MSYPEFRLEVNGEPMSSAAMSLIKSVTVEDREGDRADSLQFELLDGPEVGWVDIPSTDAIIKVWIGYRGEGLSYFGAFSDADVELAILPYGLSVSAKAADMTEDLKKHQERHWDGATVGAVLSELAGENGLQPVIAEAFASQRFPKDYAAMQGESVLHFGRRIADNLGGLFSVKDGKLILAEKTSGKSASGKTLPPLLIDADLIQPGSCTVTFSAREKVAEVEAEHHDQDAAERKTVAAPTPGGDGTGTKYRLRGAYADATSAESAAKAKARELAASADRLSLTIEGSPAARAGAPLVLTNLRPGVDGIVWIIDAATHSLAKGQGYTTQISAKRKPD